MTNVLDVDAEMRMSALSREDAACGFFDFRAALPSFDQRLMLELLTWSGIPPRILHFVSGLYRDNVCQIVVADQRFAGFR